MFNHRRSLTLLATLLAAIVAKPDMTSAEQRKDTARISKSNRSNKDEERNARRQRDKESRSDARADMADPSGDYKAYPNWARAALGPKFDD